MNKKMLFALAAITIIGSGVFASGVIAQTASADQNPMSTLVQKIADKFGLNKDDVQAVFDQVREEHILLRQAQLEERLTQAVSDGKITEAQKQAILGKIQEMKNNKPDPEQFQNMTEEQRRQTMEQRKTELESWAKQQGVDLETLRKFIGFGHKGFGMGGFLMHGFAPSSTPTQ